MPYEYIPLLESLYSLRSFSLTSRPPLTVRSHHASRVYGTVYTNPMFFPSQTGFTGIDAVYQPPEKPELDLKAGDLTVDECLEQLVELLTKKVKHVPDTGNPIYIKRKVENIFRKNRLEFNCA